MKSFLRIFALTAAATLVVPPAHAADNSNVVYEIFVRSFCDSDEPMSATARGDLAGITSKLDSYLNDGDPSTDHDLEVGGLWLMPIFPADSYHGYNVKDYTQINPDYGTRADFDALIAAAHRRGVRIILDLPINHTSTNHAWFQQALAGDAEMRKRYFFRSADQPAQNGWRQITHKGVKVQYFALFDGSMPDLNFDEPSVKKATKEIARFWLDHGVDGFRLDAAKHIFGDAFSELSEQEILKNNDWWLEFSNFCYTIKSDAILVGEVLGSAEVIRRHAYGLELLLDEPFMKRARDQMAFPKPGFVAGVASRIGACREVNAAAPHHPNRPFEFMHFVGSHDENPRLASKLEDQKRRGMAASVDEAYRIGMYLLLTMGDMPVLYYGEEIMLRGWKWDGGRDRSGIYDETLREPFQWHKSGDGAGQTRWFAPRFDNQDDGVSVEEQAAPRGMLSLSRALMNLRTRQPALTRGELGRILTDSEDWLVFERVLGRERLLVLINQKGAENSYVFHDSWFPEFVNSKPLFRSDGRLREWEDTSGSNASIGEQALVPPYGLLVLRAPSNE